ncbi:TIGR02647 family protein [Saccharospirillum impatiens]|uniref:TIGR02647 family protein n=1 Tax=Saccharospirillum impatiens TaxID=169438 RepID=UPI0003FE1041|nr:TIGR02647 family protein [Saccharospirillum impatiens]
MPFSDDHLAELNLLTQFRASSLQEGIKVHSHEANPALVAAAERLHVKGLITHRDGGYLTDLGIETVDHTRKLLGILANE